MRGEKRVNTTIGLVRLYLVHDLLWPTHGHAALLLPTHHATHRHCITAQR